MSYSLEHGGLYTRRQLAGLGSRLALGIGTALLVGCMSEAASSKKSPVDEREERYKLFHLPVVNGKERLTPFMKLPLKAETEYTISQGWIYNDDEYSITGVTEHLAVDWRVARRTSIYAPFTGYYQASYQLIPDLIQRELNRQRVVLSFGRFCEGYHPERDEWIQIAHMEEVDDIVPWRRPVQGENGVWNPPPLYISPDRLASHQEVRLIHEGEIIGLAGSSGLFLGEFRDFDGEPTRRAVNPGVASNYWDPWHLHGEIFRRRHVVGPNKEGIGSKWARIDPYASYGVAPGDYPQMEQPLELARKPLIHTDDKGLPLFAAA